LNRSVDLAEYPLIGFQSTCGILERVATGSIKEHMNRDNLECWESIPGLKNIQIVSFLGESSVKRARAKQQPGDTSYRTLTVTWQVVNQFIQL